MLTILLLGILCQVNWERAYSLGRYFNQALGIKLSDAARYAV